MENVPGTLRLLLMNLYLHDIDSDHVDLGDTLSDKGKRAKYYQLTRAGRRQLVSEQSKWVRLSAAMSRVLRLAEGE